MEFLRRISPPPPPPPPPAEERLSDHSFDRHLSLHRRRKLGMSPTPPPRLPRPPNSIPPLHSKITYGLGSVEEGEREKKKRTACQILARRPFRIISLSGWITRARNSVSSAGTSSIPLPSLSFIRGGEKMCVWPPSIPGGRRSGLWGSHLGASLPGQTTHYKTGEEEAE